MVEIGYDTGEVIGMRGFLFLDTSRRRLELIIHEWTAVAS